MTEKQEKILNIALKLFNERGYANTSTQLIASEAGVSEGLIFRHFKSKVGLLDALIDAGVEKMTDGINPILEEKDPKKLLGKSLDLVKFIHDNNLEHWHLQFALKYQLPEIAQKYHETAIFKKVEEEIENAFIKLGSENPKAERKLFTMMLISMISLLKNDKKEDRDGLIEFIKSKYNL